MCQSPLPCRLVKDTQTAIPTRMQSRSWEWGQCFRAVFPSMPSMSGLTAESRPCPPFRPIAGTFLGPLIHRARDPGTRSQRLADLSKVLPTTGGGTRSRPSRSPLRIHFSSCCWRQLTPPSLTRVARQPASIAPAPASWSARCSAGSLPMICKSACDCRRQPSTCGLPCVGDGFPSTISTP